jgi:hypothetical protein
MATSGTVGATTVDAVGLIEDAFRQCGKLPSTVSAELLDSARAALYKFLASLATRGLSLWCIEKQTVGVLPYRAWFALQTGTVDVLSVLYRLKTDIDGIVISGTGWQGIDAGENVEVDVASIMFAAAQTTALTVDSSDDQVTWTTRATFSTPLVATADWRCCDVDNSASARYWRIATVGGGALPTLSQIAFSTITTEIPMSKLNRDDYVALPNKNFSVPAGTNVLQFWYDKQLAPRIWIWPQSQSDEDQIVVWAQRQIQDVGALTNTLEVPARWLEAITYGLSSRLALLIPPNELPPGRQDLLDGKYAESLVGAEDGETDGSPIRLQPNIMGYTA